MTEAGTQPDDSGDAPAVDGNAPARDTPPVVDPPAGDTTPDSGTVLTDNDGPQGAPETYADFDLPGEMTLDEAMLTEASPVFKELGLSQIQAQSLVNFYANNLQAKSSANSESYNQQMQDWVAEAKNDKEIGLSIKEQLMLSLFVQNIGNTVTTQMLRDYVGNGEDIEAVSMSTIIHMLKSKLKSGMIINLLGILYKLLCE
mgnify:CR=1 FL=1